jgi:hypothetical protein
VGWEGGWRGGDYRGNVSNLQYKPIGVVSMNPLLYNEYIAIKKLLKHQREYYKVSRQYHNQKIKDITIKENYIPLSLMSICKNPQQSISKLNQRMHKNSYAL